MSLNCTVIYVDNSTFHTGLFLTRSYPHSRVCYGFEHWPGSERALGIESSTIPFEATPLLSLIGDYR